MLAIEQERRISDMDNTVAAVLQPIPLSAVLADYAELFKLRVNSLVVLTSWCGAYLAMGHFSWPSLVHIVVGIGSVAAGTAALNEVLERDSDGKMLRTARRPLVTGRISISAAVFLGVGLVIGGVFYLVILANILTGALALLTSVVYLFVYTPWKTYGPACTAVGAIPGAMPVVLGWASAGGAMDSRALLLFSILYLWQFPHFHAIALLYREDYRRAGIRMLAVVDRKRTSHCDTDSCLFSLLGCRQHHSVRFASQWHRLRRIRRRSGSLVVLARDPALPGIVRFERCDSCAQPRFVASDNYLPAAYAWRMDGQSTPLEESV